MQILGTHMHVLQETDSTNNYAMQMIEQNSAKHGDAWLAIHQTQGKGQRGKQWVSEKGKNITLSIAVKIDSAGITEQFYFLAAMALAARSLFARYVYEADKVKLKWPNDVYWGDIKAGGILIENKISGQNWKWAVVGFGINVNQEEFETSFSKKAVSLKMIRGVEFDVETLAQELCTEADKWFQIFEDKDYQKILQEYNQHLYKKGEKVRLKKDTFFEAEVIGVNSDGELMVKTDMLESFGFGEIEWDFQ